MKLPVLLVTGVAANHTYCVQAGDAFESGPGWHSVADVLAMPTNRIVELVRPMSGAVLKFFRVVTPRLP